VHHGVDAPGQDAGQVAGEPTAGDVGDGPDVDGLQQRTTAGA
jgi:hypothetical protein